MIARFINSHNHSFQQRSLYNIGPANLKEKEAQSHQQLYNSLPLANQLSNRNNLKAIQTSEKMFKKRAVKQQQILDHNLNPVPSHPDQNHHQPQSSQSQSSVPPIQPSSQQPPSRQHPQKKVKLDLPATIISSSTSQNKDKKQSELHDEFKSLNYSAAQNTTLEKEQQKPAHSKEQLILEEELAKQKYMENVNMTKDIKEGKVDTTVYRGINSYANYALTEEEIVNAEEKFRKRQGPSRVNSTIRNTCRFDYNFGLCKDWHDSGYCPFGDSCIYLHDRSNYKTGWEQQRDFQRTQKERWRRISNPDMAAKEDIEQALKCIEKYKVNDTCEKCNKTFKSPVQVECGHIFCSSCALTMNKCVTCKKVLSGIMNNADKKMQKMKQSYEEMKARVLKEHEENKVKRKRHDKLDSQNVFAD